MMALAQSDLLNVAINNNNNCKFCCFSAKNDDDSKDDFDLPVLDC